jgi:hypothetical protein
MAEVEETKARISNVFIKGSRDLDAAEWEA